MTKHNTLPVLWFFLGFGLFIFTRRSEIVPTIGIAIIIAPLFILGFIRTQTTDIWYSGKSTRKSEYQGLINPG